MQSMLNGGRNSRKRLDLLFFLEMRTSRLDSSSNSSNSSRSKKKATDSASVSEQRADSEHKVGQGRHACERYDDMRERAE